MTVVGLAPVISLIVVDDHPVVRDGIKGMLAGDERFEIAGEAADGAEALAVIRHRDPDVVLLDLRMPVLDGVAVIRALRSSPGRRPRVLVLTTYDTDRDIHAAIDAGADGYLLKDMTKAQLTDAVVRVAAGQKILASAAMSALMTRGHSDSLTDREVDVLRALADGGTNRDVARRLLVSEATVKTHLIRLYGKLGVRDRAAAVRVAFERGLIR